MAFLGMRGTGDWATNQRPKNWREMILYLYPNGSAPLTAILSMLSSEKTDDPTYNWWTKTLPEQADDAQNSGVYTDPNLSTAYSGDNYSAGSIVYFNLSASGASEFREGHEVLLRKDGDYRYDTVGKVTNVATQGTSSYLAIKLLEDTSATYDLEDVDRVMVIGNLNAEGATIPDSIAYDPVQHYNKTQIFRTPLSITRTARKTRLRTGDSYDEAKREALELHAIEIEKAFMYGIMSENTGKNGKPERTTAGLIRSIADNEPDNVDAYHLNTSYSGKTWLQGGEDWLNNQLEVIFRYGDTEKLAFCGSKALLAIQDLAKLTGDIQLQTGQTDYGLRVVEWITPFGTLYLKTHPLFSKEATDRNTMVIFEPRKLGTRYIDDTFFVEDPEDRVNRNNSRDGTEEEYISELGLEYHHTPAFGTLYGVGKTNSV